MGSCGFLSPHFPTRPSFNPVALLHLFQRWVSTIVRDRLILNPPDSFRDLLTGLALQGVFKVTPMTLRVVLSLFWRVAGFAE